MMKTYIKLPGSHSYPSSRSWSCESDEMFTANVTDEQGSANLKQIME